MITIPHHLVNPFVLPEYAVLLMDVEARADVSLIKFVILKATNAVHLLASGSNVAMMTVVAVPVPLQLVMTRVKHATKASAARPIVTVKNAVIAMAVADFAQSKPVPTHKSVITGCAVLHFKEQLAGNLIQIIQMFYP